VYVWCYRHAVSIGLAWNRNFMLSVSHSLNMVLMKWLVFIWSTLCPKQFLEHYVDAYIFYWDSMYLYFFFLLIKRKPSSLLGIISVENKLKHGTSISNQASPGEPWEVEAERTSKQTSSVTNKCDKPLEKNQIRPYIWWRCSLNYTPLGFSPRW
jgi:hypothetical protein